MRYALIVSCVLSSLFLSQIASAGDDFFHARRHISFENDRSYNITATDQASNLERIVLPDSQHHLDYYLEYLDEKTSQGGQITHTIVVTSDVDSSTICTLTVTTAYPHTHSITSDNSACSITPLDEDPATVQGMAWWSYVLYHYKDQVTINPAPAATASP